MNKHAQEFLDQYGRDETERVCKVAGTTIVYFEQVCAGKRNFSRKLAARLEAASNLRMDKVALIFGAVPPVKVEERLLSQAGIEPIEGAPPREEAA